MVCRVSSLATVSFILAVISPLVIVSSSSAFFIARCLLTVCFSPSSFLRFFICFSLFLFLDTVAHFTRAVPCALNERKVGPFLKSFVFVLFVFVFVSSASVRITESFVRPHY